MILLRTTNSSPSIINMVKIPPKPTTDLQKCENPVLKVTTFFSRI